MDNYTKLSQDNKLTHTTQDYNIEAENTVIQAILLDGELVMDIGATVKDHTYFSRGHNRNIYQAVQSLVIQGKPIDYLHITTELAETGKLDEMGGPGAVSGYLESVSFIPLESALSAGKMVAESFHKRIALQVLKNAYSEAAAANGDLQSILSEQKERINKLGDFVDQEKSGELPWKPKRISEALAPKEPREYVVSGLLNVPSLSVWYGPPGNLKTMVMADLALAVATGNDWLGSRPKAHRYVAPFKVTHSPVLWIDQDSGQDELERRFAALAKNKNVTESTPFYYESFPMPALLGDDPKMIDMVIQLAISLEVRLIVIDNLNSICGNADENSPQMATIASGLRRLAEKAKAAVAAIAHPSKDNYKNLRGHGSVFGALDMAMSIRRETPDALDIVFEPTKTRQMSVSPFGAYFGYTQKEDDLTTLDEACFFGTGAPDLTTSGMSQVNKIIAMIREIKPQSANQSAIVNEIKETYPDPVGRNTILDAIKLMVSTGALANLPGKRKNEILYTLVV